MSENIKKKIEIKEEIKQIESDNIGETADVNQTSTSEEIEIEEVETDSGASKPREMFAWILTAAILALVGIVGIAWMANKKSAADVNVETAAAEEGHSENETGHEVKLEPETLATANVETEGVTQRPAVAMLRVTGTIEANPQQTQQVTSLVSGRIEQVYASIGDRVSAGETVATLMSREIAENYGKWREAETRLELARKNLDRVKRAENRVNVLQAKARLDEAEATLRRVKRLIELQAGAGKDLISAETNYKTAQADYEFQRNIPLNKEIADAEAELKTAQIDATHQKQSLQALGANVSSTSAQVQNVALIPLKATVSGIVTERLVSGGAGVQAGQPLFTLTNVSTVWVTANVPQNQLGLIKIGSIAEITTPVLGAEKLNARVTYIDPQINEDSRTATVRLAVNNPGEKLRAGMFAEIGFQTSTNAATGEELVVNSDAVQRVGEKTVVFVPKEGEAGAFEVREVETGGEIEGYTRIVSGLKVGETVVTKGSFILKTQLEKGALGDDH